MKTQAKVVNKIALVLVSAVVLVIISIVFMADTTSSPGMGRNAKRVSDIKLIQAALELYASECGGFPDVPNPTIIGSPDFDTSFHKGCPEGITMGKYMQSFPISPQPKRTKWNEFMSYIFNSPIPASEPYTYCSTASTDSLECASSRESYIIPFSLEGQMGGLSGGKHFATPKGIQ